MTHLWHLYEVCTVWVQGMGVGHCAAWSWTLEGVSLPW